MNFMDMMQPLSKKAVFATRLLCVVSEYNRIA